MPATDIGVLLEEAKCYACYGAGSVPELAKLALLSRLASGGGYAAPGPNTLRYYDSVGFTDVSAPVGSYDLSAIVGLKAIIVNNAPLILDIIVNGVGSDTLEELSLIDQTSMQIVNLANCIVFRTLYAPVLASVGNTFSIANAPLSGAPITSISLPALVSTSATFGFIGLNNLTTVSLPSAVNLSNVIVINECPLLTSITWPTWAPGDGGLLIFTNDGLDQSSVDHILARCVAQGLSATTITLQGGDNASPGVQGALDAADLITAGCVVVTN